MKDKQSKIDSSPPYPYSEFLEITDGWSETKMANFLYDQIGEEHLLDILFDDKDSHDILDILEEARRNNKKKKTNKK